MMRILSCLILSVVCFMPAKAQKVTPLWQDFITAKAQGKTPVLPDFSYAGYHFSEKKSHPFQVNRYLM